MLRTSKFKVVVTRKRIQNLRKVMRYFSIAPPFRGCTVKTACPDCLTVTQHGPCDAVVGSITLIAQKRWSIRHDGGPGWEGQTSRTDDASPGERCLLPRVSL